MKEIVSIVCPTIIVSFIPITLIIIAIIESKNDKQEKK